MTGAMLLGEADFIHAAKPWRRRLGGNPFTVLPYAVSCCVAFRRHAAGFEPRYQKLAQIASKMNGAFGELGLRFVPETPHCCQTHCYLRGSAAALDAARDAVEASLGLRVYERLRGIACGDGGSECYFEWTLGPSHLELEDEVWLTAWSAFFHAVAEAEQAGSTP